MAKNVQATQNLLKPVNHSFFRGLIDGGGGEGASNILHLRFVLFIDGF